MKRKVRAVSGPPIAKPITTRSPVSVANRIVVRMVAPKVDCLVVVIDSLLVGWGAAEVLPGGGKSPMGGNPYSHPLG